MTVRPASRFTSVDFPVPDEPSRTNVFAGSEQRPNVLDALARDVAHCVDGDPDRDALRLDELAGVVADVELGEHDHGIAARCPRQR